MDDLPRLLAGRLCLDFLNTIDPRHGRDQIDYVPDYPALVRWAGHAGAVPPALAGTLLDTAAEQPRRAEQTVSAAIEFREQLYRVVRGLLDNAVPAQRALSAVNAAITTAQTARQLAPGPAAALAWRWNQPDRLDAPLLPVALSAADLLTSGDLSRVHECPGTDGCGWLFLDTSKSGTRRWCSMRVCGNRAKARRHRASTIEETSHVSGG